MFQFILASPIPEHLSGYIVFGLIVLPGQPSMIYMLMLFCAAIYASMYGIQSLHFAILEEGDYPLSTTGAATAPSSAPTAGAPPTTPGRSSAAPGPGGRKT